MIVENNFQKIILKSSFRDIFYYNVLLINFQVNYLCSACISGLENERLVYNDYSWYA